MRSILTLAACLALSVGALADGTVKFANYATGANAVNAPIRLANGDLAGTTISAQLLGGAPGGSLSPLGSPLALLNSGAAGSGYFIGGSVTIPGIPDGGAADVAVRAWENSFASYDAAVTGGGQYGISPTLSLGATGNPATSPPGTPVNLVGLQGFTLQVIPEPSTLALLGLGALALVVRRRK